MIFHEEKTLYSHKILENIKDNEDIGKSVFAKKISSVNFIVLTVMVERNWFVPSSCLDL